MPKSIYTLALKESLKKVIWGQSICYFKGPWYLKVYRAWLRV